MDQTQRAAFPGPADTSPGNGLRLLFIHHSCGGQLLAAPGPEAGEQCIYESHPNGGGLRWRLKEAGYEVHEASYGSKIGEHTDHFDWLPKFREQMEAVLTCEHQDRCYGDAGRNHIVMFKSCFPNNLFLGRGVEPGQPDGPELTVWNAKAAYQALLPIFGRHPDVLFVCLTPPPLAQPAAPGPRWKQLARQVLGRETIPPSSAALAREFNSWLSSPAGWLQGGPPNVATFDLYDLLTDSGASDWSRYPSRGGKDSHPSRQGNAKVAEALVPFLARAVRRAGLVKCVANV